MEEIKEKPGETEEERELDAAAQTPAPDNLTESGISDGEPPCEEEDEAIKEFGTQTVEPPKKRKYGWVGYLLLVAVICLSVWMMMEIVMSNTDEYKSFGDVLNASDWRFALISLAVLVVMLACIWFEYVVVIKATTGKVLLRTGMKVAFLGKFYDNVTPFATGGQPMQIYYLHKKGISGGTSSAIVLTKYFVWMVCWTVVSLLLMACNVGVLEGTGHKVLLLTLGWIGLGINMLLPIGVLLFVIVPKFANKLAAFVVNIGAKIKIVKDKEKTLGKATKVVSDFRASFKIISRRPLLFIVLIILCLIEVFLNYALPYFIMKMYSGITSPDLSVMIAVTALNTYVTLGVAIIPTPGNTGAMEGIGALAFAVFVGGSVQFWSMFTWRFAIYYIYIVIGLILTVYEFIRKIYRARKAKRLQQVQQIHEETPKE